MHDLWTTSGWWIGLAGVLVGVVGLIYGVWARTHPKRTTLRPVVNQRRLAMPGDPRLEVRFDGSQVARPTFVEVLISHEGGPEVAAEGIPADGITIRSSKPVILGGLGATESEATVTPSLVTVSPYLVQAGAVHRVDLLADDVADYEVEIRVANVVVVPADNLSRRGVLRGLLTFAVVIFMIIEVAWFLREVPSACSS